LQLKSKPPSGAAPASRASRSSASRSSLAVSASRKVELDRDSWLHHVGDERCSILTAEADDVPDEEVAAAMLLLPGVDRESDVEPALEHPALLFGELLQFR
jgi:hypothetical protein